MNTNQGANHYNLFEVGSDCYVVVIIEFITNIHLSNPNEIATVTVLDIQKKVIKEETIQASQNIDIQNVSKGLYFVHVRSKNNLSTIRLIKK